MLGSAPAPRPLVSLRPIWMLDRRRVAASSACTSVLATMNSTPLEAASTMRLTALLPPPPTPTTLIRAPVALSASSVSRSGSRTLLVVRRRRPTSCSSSVIVRPPVAARSTAARRPQKNSLKKPRSRAGHRGRTRPPPTARRLARAVAMRVQHQPDRGREHRTGHVIGQAADAGGVAAADRQVEDLLGDLRHAFEHRAAAGEHDARS